MCIYAHTYMYIRTHLYVPLKIYSKGIRLYVSNIFEKCSYYKAFCGHIFLHCSCSQEIGTTRRVAKAWQGKEYREILADFVGLPPSRTK